MLGKVYGSTSAVKNLLAYNRKILQGMSKLRLDFAKPFVCIQNEGNFTNNSIIKQVEKYINTHDSIIYVLIENPYWHDRLYVVGVCDGSWDIEIGRRVYNSYNHLDYYYAKKKVEEHRKQNTKYFIIAQETQYIIPLILEKKLDLNERVRITKTTRYGKREEEYIHSVNCVMYNDYKTKGEYHPCRSLYDCKPVSTNNIYDIIDKSGYIVDSFRFLLHHRAELYKREKNKAKAKAHDCTNEVEDFKKEMVTIKNMLANYIKETNEPNYSLIRTICNTMISLKGRVNDLAEYEFSTEENKVEYLLNTADMIMECKKALGWEEK